MANMRAGCASPDTPFAFLEALARLGQPQAALQALQARAGTPGAAAMAKLSLQQVQAAVQLHLECGSVAEAFLEVRCWRKGQSPRLGA